MYVPCCVNIIVNIYIPMSVSYGEDYYVWYMIAELPCHELELNCTKNYSFSFFPKDNSDVIYDEALQRDAVGVPLKCFMFEVEWN